MIHFSPFFAIKCRIFLRYILGPFCDAFADIYVIHFGTFFVIHFRTFFVIKCRIFLQYILGTFCHEFSDIFAIYFGPFL